MNAGQQRSKVLCRSDDRRGRGEEDGENVEWMRMSDINKAWREKKSQERERERERESFAALRCR